MGKSEGGDLTIMDLGQAKKAGEKKSLSKKHAGLVVIEGLEIGREFRLRKKESFIGRGAENDIVIKGDSLISRQHAKVEIVYDQDYQPLICKVVDLKSTNRTYVNAKPVEMQLLRDGDKIQVGETLLKFVLQDEADVKFQGELARRINMDPLTGVLTRGSFEAAMEAEFERSRKFNLPFSIMMLDLDHFKRINDSYGHQAGDQVLSATARLMQENLRGNVDLIGRFGGEEFIVLLPEMEKLNARVAAERIRARLEREEYQFDAKRISVTVSIGVSQFPLDGMVAKELIRRADKALYRAKAEGRNKVVLARSVQEDDTASGN